MWVKMHAMASHISQPPIRPGWSTAAGVCCIPSKNSRHMDDHAACPFPDLLCHGLLDPPSAWPFKGTLHHPHPRMLNCSEQGMAGLYTAALGEVLHSSAPTFIMGSM